MHAPNFIRQILITAPNIFSIMMTANQSVIAAGATQGVKINVFNIPPVTKYNIREFYNPISRNIFTI
jgi:hypothetical protein